MKNMVNNRKRPISCINSFSISNNTVLFMIDSPSRTNVTSSEDMCSLVGSARVASSKRSKDDVVRGVHLPRVEGLYNCMVLSVED